MRNCFFVLCFIFMLSSCFNDDKSQFSNSYEKSSLGYLQFYVDSSSYYYLRAIEEIEDGGDVKFTESRYADKIIVFHKKFSTAFDSVTKEYMNKKLSQRQYDEIRNSIFFDSVVKRAERLSQLGLNVNLK